MIKEKSCGCIVFNELNEVLLVQMHSGHWSFPKGHVEENETEKETALRETKEETNIDCHIIDGFREVNTYSPFKGTIKDVVFFLATVSKSTITKQDEEIKNASFVNVEKAKKLITYKNDLHIFKLALEYKTKHNI